MYISAYKTKTTGQDTGQAIKKFWDALTCTGMFGPIKV